MNETISVIKFNIVIVYIDTILKPYKNVHNITKTKQLTTLIFVYKLVYPHGNNLHPPKNRFKPDTINVQDIIIKTIIPLV